MMDSFIGRQEELEALNEIFKDSIEKGKVVLISGKPGSGKNTLVNKFLSKINNNDALIISLDARFYEGLSPFMKIITMIKDSLQLDPKATYELLNLFITANNDLDLSEIRGDAPYDIFNPILNNSLFMTNLTIKESQLLHKLREYLDAISNLLSSMNLRLVIVLDHTELLHESSLKLIMNIIDDFPARFMLILLYELNDDTKELYEKLGDALINYEMGIIELSSFSNEEVLELFNKENIPINSLLASNIREKLKGNPLYITRLIEIIKCSKLQINENNIPSINEIFKLFFSDLNKDEIETLSILAILKDPFTDLEIDNIPISKEKLKHFIGKNIIVHENNVYSFAHPDDRAFFASFLSNEEQRSLYENIIAKLKNEVGNGPKVSFSLISRICWYSFKMLLDENSVRLCIVTARIAHDKALFLTALKMHKEALSALQRLTIQDSRLMTAIIHYWLGIEYLIINDEKNALRNLEKALKNFERLGKIEAVGATLYIEGILSERKGDIKDAAKSFEEAIKMFETLKNNTLKKYVKIYALLKLSRIKLKLEKIDEAINLSTLALNLAHEINDKLLILLSLYEIGLIKYTTGEFNEAINTLNDTLKLLHEANNVYIIPHIYFYLGLAYLGNNEIERAAENFKKSIDIAKEIEDKKIEALSLAQLSVIHSSTGSYNTALSLLKEAHKKLLNLEDWENITRINYLIATVLLSLGDVDKAFDKLIEMLDASAKTGNDMLFFRSFKMLLEIFEEMMQKDLWAQLSKGLDKIINAYADTEAIELENFFKILKEMSLFKITKSMDYKNSISKLHDSINSKELKNIINSIIAKYAPELTL
jgi:tetratricopeptide (TPR) repeat protein